MSAGVDLALSKIERVVGEDRARDLVEETLRRIGRKALVTPDDYYRFAVELMKKGGALEAVGRSIKIQAILLGARES